MREVEREVEVCARIADGGSLDREVIVTLSTQDDSALGEHRKHILVLL